MAKPSPFNPTRRRFFSALTAAAAASEAARAADGMGSMAVADRLAAAHRIRLRAAGHYLDLGAAPQPDNGDEQRYPSLINTFSKTLRHNNLGEVNRESYESMIRAIQSGRKEDFDAVLRGGNVALKNPMASFTYQSTGADPCQFGIRAAPAFDSAEQAGEMVGIVLAGAHARHSLCTL